MAIQRIALSQPIESRKASFDKDSYTANVVFETHDQTRDFVKRPGLVKKATIVETTPPVSVAGQGLFEFQNNLYSVIDDEIYKVDPDLGTVIDLAPFPTDTLTNHRVYGTKTFNGLNLFMHNGEKAVLIDGADTVTEIINDHVISIDVLNGGVNYSTGCTLSISAPPLPSTSTATATVEVAGSAGGSIVSATVTYGGADYVTAPTVTIVKPAPATTNGQLYSGTPTVRVDNVTGIYTGMRVDTTDIYANTTYYFSTGAAYVTKITPDAIGTGGNLEISAIALHSYTGTLAFGDEGVSAVLSANLNAFPSVEKVPGAVYLDQYIFIGGTDNKIYNSTVTDPSSWEPLSYISFEQTNDTLVGISRYLNYLVAFGGKSIQFFYDAAIFPGSPLSLAPSYTSEMGCVNGDSIVHSDQTVFWLGTSKTEGRGVYLLDGTSPTRVSSTFVERYLEKSNCQEITAYSYKFDGHLLYLLTLHDLDVTLVYDAVEKVWHKWTTYGLMYDDSPAPSIYGESYFNPCFFAKVDNKAFVMSFDKGILYYFDQDTYTDDGVNIYCRAVTDIVDNGTTNRKFYNRLEIVGNKVGGTMKIRHTSDDYQTWSQYRSVDLSKIRSQIYQSGQSRRRAWEFLCTDPVPLRLDCAEIDFEVGGLDPQQGVGGGTRYRR